jgi:hypothetical protein
MIARMNREGELTVQTAGSITEWITINAEATVAVER